MPAETQSMNLESLHAIATMVAQQRNVDAVLETVVESLVESLDLALARIWLNQPGDICEECVENGVHHMADNIATTLELKEIHLEHLDEMAKKHNLPDRSKALRCLVTFAMEQSEHENPIFTDVRCTNCLWTDPMNPNDTVTADHERYMRRCIELAQFADSKKHTGR